MLERWTVHNHAQEKCCLQLFIHWYTFILWYIPTGLCSLYFDVILPVIHTAMNDFLLLYTHTHTRRLTNSACSSRTRLLILITEQRKTSIISLICLLSRKSRKWCSFYPGPVSSVYWSSSAQMEAEFSWVSVSVGVCVGVGKSGCRSLSDLSCKRDTVQGWIS